MTEQQQAKIVADILAAKTLYDVLGVSPNNMATLRKAYLTTSVKVHPDKNQHPQATEAFQRVAEAWGTLSDDVARADYDAELRNASRYGSSTNKSSSAAASNDNTQYANDFERSHMPSFQDALFMFATATAMFSGASSGGGGEAAGSASRSGSAATAASDFMETLVWAQQLAENRRKDDSDGNNNKNADPNDPGYNQSRSAGVAETAANNPMASGMALGSGLRAFASAQRAMGMKKSAAATEKAATTLQVAAMGATVLKAANENPAVKRTLDRGSETLKNNPQIAKGFRASVKMAGSIVMALAEAQKDSQQQQQAAAAAGAAGNKR